MLKELPRVEEQLTELLNNYERTYGHVLYINGKDYRKFVNEQWTIYEEAKENEKLQRVMIQLLLCCVNISTPRLI